MKSFSETTVLIEIDENLKYLSDLQGEQPEDNLIHNNNDKLFTFSEMTGDAIWLEYSTESELDSLIKYVWIVYNLLYVSTVEIGFFVQLISQPRRQKKRWTKNTIDLKTLRKKYRYIQRRHKTINDGGATNTY